MGTLAGVGFRRHRNPKVAGTEAAKQALENGGFDEADFVFLFSTAG